MMPELVTPASGAPLTAADVRLQIPMLGHTDDDAQLTALIDAAVAYMDGYAGVLGRCIVNQTWRERFGNWYNPVQLVFPDVSSATVNYYDTDNVARTVDAGMYEIVHAASGCQIWFNQTFDNPGLGDANFSPVWIEYVAGYGPVGDAGLPTTLKMAIILLVEHWYEKGEGSMPASTDAMIAPFRNVRP